MWANRLPIEFAARLCGYLSILITAMAPDEKVTAADEREGFASQLSRAHFIPGLSAVGSKETFCIATVIDFGEMWS